MLPFLNKRTSIQIMTFYHLHYFKPVMPCPRLRGLRLGAPVLPHGARHLKAPCTLRPAGRPGGQCHLTAGVYPPYQHTEADLV